MKVTRLYLISTIALLVVLFGTSKSFAAEETTNYTLLADTYVTYKKQNAEAVRGLGIMGRSSDIKKMADKGDAVLLKAGTNIVVQGKEGDLRQIKVEGYSRPLWVTVQFTPELAASLEEEKLVGFINYPGASAHDKAVIRNEIVKRHPEWPAAVRKQVEERSIAIGMTIPQVLASWGEPKTKNTSVGSWGKHEQWKFENNYTPTYYVYFEDGLVSSFQKQE